MSALVANGYTAAPHHRQNRRRERPGSRSRRAAPRKSLLQESFLIQDSLDEACDSRNAKVSPPLVKATPSPLLRQNFDQSWERWKAREAQQKAQAELLEKTLQYDMTQLELEQRRLFGGDVGDDVSLCESMLQELYALGILYEDEEAEGFLVIEEPPPPAFVIRPGRSRRPGRSARGKLSHDSSFYIIESDTATAAGMPAASPTQHGPINDDTPRRSLPPLTSTTISETASIPERLDSISSPAAGDWTIVQAADAEQQQQQHTQASSTPPSEPETWILLGDDS